MKGRVALGLTWPYLPRNQGSGCLPAQHSIAQASALGKALQGEADWQVPVWRWWWLRKREDG